MDKSSFAERLKELRKKAGYTQSGLAEAIQLSIKTVQPPVPCEGNLLSGLSEYIVLTLISFFTLTSIVLSVQSITQGEHF